MTNDVFQLRGGLDVKTFTFIQFDTLKKRNQKLHFVRFEKQNGDSLTSKQCKQENFGLEKNDKGPTSRSTDCYLYLSGLGTLLDFLQFELVDYAQHKSDLKFAICLANRRLKMPKRGIICSLVKILLIQIVQSCHSVPLKCSTL